MNAPATTPRRSDAYEKQLSDGELLWLHSQLSEAKLSLKKVRTQAPKWRAGKFSGKPPSIGTLHNIKVRLELEEDLAEVEATTETVLDAMKREDPSLSQESLDAFGLKVFTTLAIQRRDAKTFVALQKAQKGRADTALNEARFRRETCELFLQWAADQRARDIAASPTSNAEKIEQLGALMFGEDWETPVPASPATRHPSP